MIFRTIKSIGTAIALAVLMSISFSSCEGYDDSALQEAVKDLQNRVLKLEQTVAENVSALQSMVSLGSVAKCEYNAETGKTTITLLNGKTITFDQTVSGQSLVTVIEKDGKYWWGICSNGQTEFLKIDGKNVPVSVTPALKLSADNEWMISADGGNTWVNTGIYQDTGSEGEDIVFFKEVTKDGDFLYLTLADGQKIKVAIVGEAVFSASETSLWFTRANEEKVVILTMKNVKAFTITEHPEGWKAQINEEMLVINSPSDMEAADQSGTIKILAVFTNGSNPEIVSVKVQYDPELTLSCDTYGSVNIKVSEHVNEGYAGYVIKAWKENSFSPEKAASWLNSECSSLTPYTQDKAFTMAELADEYDEGESYVVFATPYIHPRAITSGEDAYSKEELLTATYIPSGTKIIVTGIRYDSANVKADFGDMGSFFGGISKTEDWNNYVRTNFIEQLGYGGMNPLTIDSYEGTAAGFPDGVKGLTIMPDTEYTLWMVSVSESGEYTDDDFMTKTFRTSDISADPSVGTPGHSVSDITYGGFTAEVTPASGAYKTYAAILPSASIPETDKEIVTRLINANNFSEGSSKFTVSSNSFSSDSDVYLLCVSMNENGGYGTIVKEKVTLKTLSFSEAIGITECSTSFGVGDVTLSLTFKGNPSSITYFVSTYTYYTDEVLENMMAMDQYGEAENVSISKLTNGNQIYLSGLEIGAEYTFYALVKDSSGTPSRMFKKTFIPSITVDYILSTADNYSYGMPEISGGWINSTSYIVDIFKPSTCVKYWISVCDPGYLTGDLWSDTDKLITETLYNSQGYTESISEIRFDYLIKESRLFIAWLDDKGNYHAIYEYNIQNDK